MTCPVKESTARGLFCQGERTAPGFVAPEWALVVIQPKTGDHSCRTLGLVTGRSNLWVQPPKLGGHPGELVLCLGQETPGERVQLQVARPRPST